MPLVLMVVVVFTGVFKKYLFSLSLSLSLSFLSHFSLSFHTQNKKRETTTAINNNGISIL